MKEGKKERNTGNAYGQDNKQFRRDPAQTFAFPFSLSYQSTLISHMLFPPLPLRPPATNRPAASRPFSGTLAAWATTTASLALALVLALALAAATRLAAGPENGSPRSP